MKVYRWWEEILAGKKKFNWFWLLVVMSFLTMVKPSYMLLTRGVKIVNDLPSQIEKVIQNHFPEDLDITIKDGVLSTNQVEPIYFTLGSDEFDDWYGESKTGRTGTKTRIITIDTKASVEDYDQYQSVALVTESSLVYEDDDGRKIVPMSSVDDMVINRDWIKEKIMPVFGPKFSMWAKVFVYVAPVFLGIAGILAQALVWIGQGLGAYIMGRVMGVNPGFGRVVSTVVAITFVPDIFDAVLGLVTANPTIESISFVISSAVLIGMAVTLYYLFVGYGPEKSK